MALLKCCFFAKQVFGRRSRLKSIEGPKGSFHIILGQKSSFQVIIWSYFLNIFAKPFCTENKNVFEPLHNYVKSTCNERGDQDGLDDRLAVDRGNFLNSLYSATICSNNEPVFRFKWNKSKLKLKYDKARDNLLNQVD